MICGIVDVGSNTIRLSIYRCEAGTVRVLMHKKTMAGLASYVVAGRLPMRGVRVVCDVLLDYRALLDNLGISEMYVFATASLRNITNSAEAVKSIRLQTGIPIDVISGKEEAALSFYGATLGMSEQKGLLLDLGGGSTELVRYAGGRIEDSCSLPFGALTLFDHFVEDLLPTSGECKNIQKNVLKKLDSEVDSPKKSKIICAVGGTARAACKVANRFFDRPADCMTMSAEELHRLYKICKKASRDTVRELLKVTPDRIHTIIPGIAALDALATAYRAEELRVSSCGVREGYLHKKVLKETDK